MIGDQILTAIGLIGIGGILKTGFDFLISKIKAKEDAKQNLKETRYKAIILLCYALAFYEREKTTLIVNRPDINSIERLKNELIAEFFNMSLFASDEVIIGMKHFIQQQNTKNLTNLAMSMRKDLFGIKTKLKDNTFEINI